MAIHPFRNFGLKCLSIAIAVMLWLILSGEQVVERGLRVPLEIQNLPAGLQLVDDPPELVDVRVKGTTGALGRLGPGDLVAVIDLRSARPGRRLIHLTTEQVVSPFGVEVAHISPPTIPLSFEQAGTRSVPVAPSVEGKPAAGFVVGRVSADPETVEVIGPQSQLRRVTSAITEPVSVDGATADLSELVNVGVLDPDIRLRAPVSARVRVQVLPAPVEVPLHDVLVRVRGVSEGVTARVTPPTVTVYLSGGREALKDLKAESLDAYVDLVGLGSGRYNLPVRVDPPPDVGVSRTDPALVEVRMR